MKRYLVFAFDSYEPHGGMDDCILKTDDWKECISILKDYQKNRTETRGQIYDHATDTLHKYLLLDSYIDNKDKDIDYQPFNHQS